MRTPSPAGPAATRGGLGVVFVTGLILMVAASACTGAAGSSASGTPAVTTMSAPPRTSAAPIALDASRFMRDAMLERALPDTFRGEPLVKWSVNAYALRQLAMARGIGRTPAATPSLDLPEGSIAARAYAAAWYASRLGSGPPLVEAIAYPGRTGTFEAGLTGDVLRNAYLRAWEASLPTAGSSASLGPGEVRTGTHCDATFVDERRVVTCTRQDGWFVSTISLYVHDETVYVLHDDGSIAAALRK